MLLPIHFFKLLCLTFGYVVEYGFNFSQNFSIFLVHFNYVLSYDILFILFYKSVQRHILTKEEVYLGMSLLKYCPVKMVDTLVMGVSAARSFMYGNLSKYGLFRPKQGPFATKLFSGKAPVIDVGTVQKICDGKIQVFSIAHQN